MAKNAIQKVGSKDNFKEILHQRDMKQSIADVVPRHVDETQIGRLMLLAVSKQPELYQCTQSSMIKALLDCAATGLDPSGRDRRANIIPRWNNKIGAMEAQFEEQVWGLLDLVRNSGFVKNVRPNLIYKNDEFEERPVDPIPIHHVPAQGTQRDEDIVGAYAIAWLTTGGVEYKLMWIDEINEVRDRYAPRNKKGEIVGGWKDNYSAMVLKTPLKRIALRLPQSPSVNDALMRNEREYHEERQKNVIDIEADQNQGDAVAATLMGEIGEQFDGEPVESTDDSPPEEAEEVEFDPQLCSDVKCKNTIDVEGEVQVKNKKKCGTNNCPRMS